MSQRLAEILALARLTWCEAIRARLWLVLAVAVVALLIWVPGLQAAEPSDRLRLSIAVITGMTGFLVVLLGSLAGAAAIRRDLDGRMVMILFSKPLGRGSFLLGRWLGLTSVIGVGILALLLVGSLAVAWRVGGLPGTVQLTEASERWRVDRGAANALPDAAAPVVLSGNPRDDRGASARWRFVGLTPDADTELMLRAQVGGVGADGFIRRSPVMVSALLPDGRKQVLAVNEASPYGHGDSRRGEVMLVNRDTQRPDATRDFARLVVPASAIAPDGSLVVQVDRLAAGGRVVVPSVQGLVVHRGDGWFLGSLFRAALVLTAEGGLLVAISLFGGAIGGLATALLIALGLFFGGSLLRFGNEWVSTGDAADLWSRLMMVVHVVVPDFERFPVAIDLAASRTVDWQTVLSAWGYFGAYLLVFLVLARLALRRDLA